MAEVVTGEKNHLEVHLERWRRRKRSARWWMAGGILLFLAGPAFTKPMYSLFGLLIVSVSAMVMRRTSRELEVLGVGLAGEKEAEEAFSNLPGEYVIYSDLEIEADGKVSQVDHVVVGPTGVFVVETKNVYGRVVGNADDADWTQFKTTESGHVYEKQMYSPVKQVGTHVYRLAERLKEEQIHVWVQGIVYFVHPDTKVEMTGFSKIPVFSAGDEGTEKLMDFILASNRKPLSKEIRERIGEVLSDCLM